MTDPTPSPKPPLKLVPKNGTPTDAADSVLFGAQAAQKPRNWTPLLAGFALVLVAIALIALLGRSRNQVPQSADPYSPMLTVEQAQLSQADNFVGSTVTYIDLTTRNNGDRTVVGGVVHAIFRDALGQAVQTETVPLRALIPVAGQQQAADLALAPLGPGQTRVLRLTIEHISSQWNQAQPELEFRALRFR